MEPFADNVDLIRVAEWVKSRDRADADWVRRSKRQKRSSNCSRRHIRALRDSGLGFNN